MPIIICGLHNLPNVNICFKNECNNLFCQECFKIHANQHHHFISVKLNTASREFFIKWSEFMLNRLHQYEHIIKNSGYNKLFQMKLQLNYPKGTVGQLNHDQIQNQALEALFQHIQLTKGNLQFIIGTKQQSQMIHPQFLKDLFNLVVEDAKYNIQNLNSNIQRKLVQKFKQKEIYQYARFHIIPKEILHLDQQRKKIINQYESQITTKVHSYNKSPTKSSGKKEIEIEIETEKQSEKYRNHEENHAIHKQQTHHYHTNHPLHHQPECQKHQHIKQIQHLAKQNHASKDLIKELQRKMLVLQSLLMQKSIQKPSSSSSQQQGQKVVPLQKFIELQQQITELKTINSEHIQKQILSNKQLIDLQNILSNLSQNQKSLQTQLQKANFLISEKERSIQNLNKLISNQEQEIKYRENQVDILEVYIKKLMDKIKSMEGSIRSLNNLISNEQEEIAYRENQVQTLTCQIGKLLDKIKDHQKSIASLNQLILNEEQEIEYRENQSQILTKQVKKVLQKNFQLQKSIHELNKLICNEEEQIAYRQNQTQNLTVQIKKLLQKIAHLQKSIHQLNNLIANQEEEIEYREGESQILTIEVKKLMERNKYLQAQIQTLSGKMQSSQQSTIANSQSSAVSQNDMQDLIEQVVILQAQNLKKEKDIQLLVRVITQIATKYKLKAQEWSQKLSKLQTLEITSA